jgi:hypothetical protein
MVLATWSRGCSTQGRQASEPSGGNAPRAFRDQLIASPKVAIAAQHRAQFGKDIDPKMPMADLRFVEP